MAKKPFKSDKSDRSGVLRCNERIRVPRVRLIRNGENVGVVETRQALRMAQEDNLDLVEISPNNTPPVCSIMDFGKYQYEKQKKQKPSTAPKEKEIIFKYVIDDHDLQTKANQAKKFLEKGNKVKLVVKFEKREKAHKEEGFVVMKQMLALLDEVCTVERQPSMDGANVIARVEPKKKA